MQFNVSLIKEVKRKQKTILIHLKENLKQKNVFSQTVIYREADNAVFFGNVFFNFRLSFL